MLLRTASHLFGRTIAEGEFRAEWEQLLDVLGMLQPPKHIRDAIDAETQVYTLAEPPKFFGKGAAGQ